MKLTKKERTQREIIQAAKEIVIGKGYEAVTVRSLAEVTGYSHTNLYYYFKDLNALLWTLRLDMIEDMIRDLTSLSYEKEDAVEEVMEIFCCYTDYFFKHPNVFRFFYFYHFVQPEGDERYEELETRLGGMYQTSFARLVQEGIVSAAEVEVTAKTVIYALQGMIMLSFSSNGSMSQDSIKEELIKIVNYLFKKSK